MNIRRILSVLLMLCIIFILTSNTVSIMAESPHSDTGDGSVNEENAVEIPFDDVQEDDWFYGIVKMAYELDIMKGITDTEFAPDAYITRAMFVTTLYRISGDTEEGKSEFLDVAEEAYYSETVAWAVKNGIVEGVSETEFAPDNIITREQMALILYRYAQYKGYDMTAVEEIDIINYKEAGQMSEWAIDAMKWAIGGHVIRGNEKGELNPKGMTTRAQAAAMLTGFLT